MNEDTTSVSRNDGRAILQVIGKSPYLVQGVIGLFADLDFAYASLSYFRVLSGRLLVNLGYRGFPYPFILPPQELFLLTVRLRFYSTSFSSPGFWEFIGKLNAIEVIRPAISDYHESIFRKGVQPYERRRRELENLLLKYEVTWGRTEVSQEMGFDNEQISLLIASTILNPAGALLTHKPNGLTAQASIRPSDSVE